MRMVTFLILVSLSKLGAQTFTSSNLPIIVIDTKGQPITDDPKVTSHMGIIYNRAGKRNALVDPLNNYDGSIGIELRGNVTQTFPKVSYNFETWDETGADLKVALLDLPKESDWVLSAAYIDKTFIRDPLMYYMSRSINRWASRTVHCELILNGVYQGIYILEEKIKRDKNRVDLTTLTETDNSGTAITGGYIYEVSQAGEEFGERRRFIYPKWSVITPEQTAYIRKYDDDFRKVMQGSGFADPVTGYAAWIDTDSFIEEILLQEAGKNSDAYGFSSYFHKDRSGKLKAGPVWDFDQALSNSTYNDGPNFQEWNVLKSLDDSPFFWEKLFNEPVFRNQLGQRWMELRAGAFKTSRLMNFIDSVATTLNEAQVRNFAKWQTLGKELFRSTPGFDERVTYQQEVDYLKTFLTNRLAWMDENLSFVLSVEEETKDITSLLNYPNPSSGKTTISYDLNKAGFVTLTLYDMLGKKIETVVQETQMPKIYQYPVSTELLQNGVYLYRLQVDNRVAGIKKMVVAK
jgi:CotH kinase protein/Secretion system C-terminal sorting domain